MRTRWWSLQRYRAAYVVTILDYSVSGTFLSEDVTTYAARYLAVSRYLANCVLPIGKLHPGLDSFSTQSRLIWMPSKSIKFVGKEWVRRRTRIRWAAMFKGSTRNGCNLEPRNNTIVPSQ